ncbi:hypothetical protein BAUCODRAFT_309494 [Baudoinia panamericana UAMH 10762]|uniref:Uncharacterized protein n=1 Tax=Baudoinia panamericana (strain UAMH 10762) TaxID=717646 RepID=M2MZX8_BAUPA|nr:uncharacterized protein BAUCODRAFT_309494 [Baudoinia panamericana UAMH 10762]EMC91880.1 hypothetical protein BAUCODRAFT_309494 [Baudoinia panamericana UAMH 10762]
MHPVGYTSADRLESPLNETFLPSRDRLIDTETDQDLPPMRAQRELPRSSRAAEKAPTEPPITYDPTRPSKLADRRHRSPLAVRTSVAKARVGGAVEGVAGKDDAVEVDAEAAEARTPEEEEPSSGDLLLRLESVVPELAGLMRQRIEEKNGVIERLIGMVATEQKKGARSSAIGENESMVSETGVRGPLTAWAATNNANNGQAALEKLNDMNELFEQAPLKLQPLQSAQHALPKQPGQRSNVSESLEIKIKFKLAPAVYLLAQPDPDARMVALALAAVRSAWYLAREHADKPLMGVCAYYYGVCKVARSSLDGKPDGAAIRWFESAITDAQGHREAEWATQWSAKYAEATKKEGSVSSGSTGSWLAFAAGGKRTENSFNVFKTVDYDVRPGTADSKASGVSPSAMQPPDSAGSWVSSTWKEVSRLMKGRDDDSPVSHPSALEKPLAITKQKPAPLAATGIRQLTQLPRSQAHLKKARGGERIPDFKSEHTESEDFDHHGLTWSKRRPFGKGEVLPGQTFDLVDSPVTTSDFDPATASSDDKGRFGPLRIINGSPTTSSLPFGLPHPPKTSPKKAPEAGALPTYNQPLSSPLISPRGHSKKKSLAFSLASGSKSKEGSPQASPKATSPTATASDLARRASRAFHMAIVSTGRDAREGPPDEHLLAEEGHSPYRKTFARDEGDEHLAPRQESYSAEEMV